MIKDLPAQEKPRERLLKYGVEKLSNEELLSIILRVGVKNTSVKEVAINILKVVGDLSNFSNMTINRLSKINGVGQIKAMTLLSAVELGKRIYMESDKKNIKIRNSDLVFELFKNKFRYVTQEKLIAIYLDAKKNLIDYKTIFIGTVNASTVHPREVYKEALFLSASAIIVIHNHPSGDPTPSTADINFTKQLEETGKIMAIPLIDHLIFGNNNYSSYSEQKWCDVNAKVR